MVDVATGYADTPVGSEIQHYMLILLENVVHETEKDCLPKLESTL
jgi:hypothetical protein